jgi:CYTH domain-containing protein
MAVKAIQLGQVWRNNQSGRNFLVTKVYSEVFTQYAILRQADASAADRDTVRVKIQKEDDGATIPGYTYTQDTQDF